MSQNTSARFPHIFVQASTLEIYMQFNPWRSTPTESLNKSQIIFYRVTIHTSYMHLHSVHKSKSKKLNKMSAYTLYVDLHNFATSRHLPMSTKTCLNSLVLLNVNNTVNSWLISDFMGLRKTPLCEPSKQTNLPLFRQSWHRL